MSKIFIIAGELSGDKAAAWYLEKRALNPISAHLEGIGGDALQRTGVTLYDRFESLNIVGIIEVIGKIPFLYAYLQRLITYIIDQNFSEIILVNFSGFNLLLAKQLKQRSPSINITYFAPPQMWCWGAWRVHALKRTCDRIDVLFPSEVAWYQKHGIDTVWLGNPIYDRLENTILNPLPQQHQIACLFGSRPSELKKLFPIFTQVIVYLLKKYTALTCVIPIASSLKRDHVLSLISKTELHDVADRLLILDGDDPDTVYALQQCCAAITKPGTITLELALLGIPAVVAYKTSWLTYLIAKYFVTVSHMALPNLLLNKEVYPECIQRACTPLVIIQHVETIYKAFIEDPHLYRSYQQPLRALQQMLHEQ